MSDIQIWQTIYLLRHGQEGYPRPDELGGELTALGQEQAVRAGARLAALPLNRVVASDFRRARQTAEIVMPSFPHIALEIDPDIRECAPSMPPGQEQLFGAFDETEASRCQAQLDRAYSRYFESDDPGIVLLVSHGTAIRYLLCRMLGLPVDAWARFDLFNCSLSRVDRKTVLGTQLTGFNDVGHLPIEMQTYG